MILTATYRNYIINDFKLPKIVTESPYFETQFSLLEEYDFKRVFDFVEECIDDFSGKPELFFDEVNQLSLKIFNYVDMLYDGKSEKYRNKYSSTGYNNSVPEFRQQLFNPKSIDREFIRIDIIQACFNVLKELTTELDDFASYEGFVHSFDMYDESVRNYVSKSKRIRSYIFGVIQKPIIIHLEKHIIGELIESIDSPLVFKDCDEIVYEYSDQLFQYIESILSSFKYRKIIRLETFHVHSLDHGYVEKHKNATIFKGVPSHYFCEIFAKYFNYDIINEYRVFNFDKVPCMRL